MNSQRLTALTLIALSTALFAALAYEPADVVAALGLTGVLNEAVAVVGGLTLVASGLIAGTVTWRRSRSVTAA